MATGARTSFCGQRRTRCSPRPARSTAAARHHVLRAGCRSLAQRSGFWVGPALVLRVRHGRANGVHAERAAVRRPAICLLGQRRSDRCPPVPVRRLQWRLAARAVVPAGSGQRRLRLRHQSWQRFRGRQCQCVRQIYNVPNREHLRLADINGDGRTDILQQLGKPLPRDYRFATSVPLPQLLDDYFYTSSGSFGSIGSSSDVVATCARGTVLADDPAQWDYFFADFDGDGATDFVSQLRDDGATPTLLQQPCSHDQPVQAKGCDFPTTTGHGALTAITYQPLTNKAIYRREKRPRGSTPAGRVSARSSRHGRQLGPRAPRCWTF